MSFKRTFARFFPAPRMLMPHGPGIDITDASVKWVTLAPYGDGSRVVSLGQQSLDAGIVVDGTVKNVGALSAVLAEVKKKLGGMRYAHASLPEEGAYVFDMHVPEGSSYEEIISMVEFELEGRVPIPVPDVVYDFDVVEVHEGGNGSEIGVFAFAREIADGYVQAFKQAGIELLSLEIEARSIARAVTRKDGTDPITLLADIGKGRTGFAILKHGIPIFTSTVEVGGDQLTKVLVDIYKFSPEEAETFKNEEGLVVTDKTKAQGAAALEKVAATLAEEVEKHYRFWDTRRNEHGERVTPVGRIVLVGGSTNLKGLPDYIAGKVHAPTERPNVWLNVDSFDEQIPPISQRKSLQYVTAIGLALRSVML